MRRAGLGAGVLWLAAACAVKVDLPGPVTQAAPCGVPGVLEAGFGRADITPPPGPGIQGYGLDGQRTRGYRHRLYARAMALRGADGYLVVLVVTDLPQVSAVLHREAAERLHRTSQGCVGADRLMLSATHTHAGPGNFFLSEVVNKGGGPVSGYDARMVDFLASGIARAAQQAVDALRPAVAAWDSAQVWGVTRNRSVEAHLRNRTNPIRPARPPHVAHLPPAYLSVNPRLLMLRVDTITAGTDGTPDTVPAGAFSIFAIHGTGNVSRNDLWDGDIHALVERRLERHMDTVAGYAAEYEPRTKHLFANGALGDVSPDWPEGRLCPVAVIRPVRDAAGPRVPRAPATWDPGPQAAAHLCVAEARAYVDDVGREIGDSAVALHGRLGPQLSGTLPIGSAFTTLTLQGNTALASCPEAATGTATLGGADDGRSRYYRWKVLGLFPTGFEDSESAITDPSGCHGRKRIAAGVLLQKVAGGNQPAIAQLMAVRAGPMLLGAVPWEVTTEAGYRMEDAMLAAAHGAGGAPAGAAVVSLANGYLQYLTTPEEYDLQTYEGGSNIYGPRTAEMAADELARVAGAAYAGGLAGVPPIAATVGWGTKSLPSGVVATALNRRVTRVDTIGVDTIAVRWTDAPPGPFSPDLGPVLRIEEETAPGRFRMVAWDDDPNVEVRYAGHGTWEVRWSRCRAPAVQRVVFPARTLRGGGSALSVTSPVFACP